MTRWYNKDEKRCETIKQIIAILNGVTHNEAKLILKCTLEELSFTSFVGKVDGGNREMDFSSEEKTYTAILDIDVTPITDCIKKVEQLIAHLERVRDLLQDIQELNSASKSY